MRKLLNLLRDIWYWFHAGIMSNTPNYHLDQQEEARRQIIMEASRGSWTDDELWNEFREYAFKHDRKLRLRRTRLLLEEIMEQRPALRARYSQKEKR